jgi:hypothetical protein
LYQPIDSGAKWAIIAIGVSDIIDSLDMEDPMRLIRLFAFALALTAIALPVSAAEPTIGNPGIKAIEAIAFGPDGLLLIGDGKGQQVVVIETGDLAPVKWATTTVPNIKEHIAGRLGTTEKGIDILKLAVNPVSHKAYIAVRKLQGKDDIVVTLDGAGKVSEFPLEKVKYTRYALNTGDPSKVKLVTDLSWTGDRILVACQATEKFDAKLFSIRLDEKEAICFSTETFHVAHGRWETAAPLRTIIPYMEGNKKYIVGAFTCTPIVRYDLDDIKPSGQVKGESVIELGYGNQPRDMFTYEKDGKHYILMCNQRVFAQKNDPVRPSPYWTVKVDQSILGERDKINQKALQRIPAKGRSSESATDRAVPVPAYDGVMHMDRLNATQAVVIRTDDKGAMDLAVLPLP